MGKVGWRRQNRQAPPNSAPRLPATITTDFLPGSLGDVKCNGSEVSPIPIFFQGNIDLFLENNVSMFTQQFGEEKKGTQDSETWDMCKGHFDAEG